MASDNVGGESAFIIGSIQLVTHRPVDLGRQDNLLTASAALLEPAADNSLGQTRVLTPAIHIGGIKKLDSRVQRRIHNPEGFFLVGDGTEVHRSQTEAAYLHTRLAKLRVLHLKITPLPYD